MSKKLRVAAVVAALLFAILGFLVGRAAAWSPLPLAGEAIDDGYSRAQGVVHVHTTLSDGGGTPEEVIAAAQGSGLDFVAITDHNHVDAFRMRGYQGGTLVLVGTEISTEIGHLLALGVRRHPTFLFSKVAADGIVDVRDLDGFLFAAHPHSPREDFAWRGWDLEGPWGLEIINGDSEWRRAGPRLLPTLLQYRVNPTYALLGLLQPPHEALASWDRLLATRDTVGIYGVDAHQRLPVTEQTHLAFPRYEELFNVARNHVLLDAPLTGDVVADRATVIAALRSGRFYMGVDGLAPADGFSFVVRDASGGQWTMGESVVSAPGLRAVAGGRVPEGATVRLLRDGEIIAEATGGVDIELPGDGAYRVEVSVDGWDVPWVISNPIAVFDAATLTGRRVAWPAAPAPVEAVEIIDDFEGGTVFAGGSDTRSRLDEPLLAVVSEAGDDNEDAPGSAARMSFRLGEPTEDHPDVFVALINRDPRDLSAYEGLTFRIKADGIYRLWVQVRDDNPAIPPEATETWAASVKTGTEWQQVSIPFSRFMSANEGGDGSLDLDAVRALVFVIDKGAMRPGSEGVIWLDDVGVY